MSVELFEAMIWKSYGIGWKKAAKIVGRDEGFDIAQTAIGKVWALRPYLHRRGLDAYFIRTCWSLAVGRYRRRWREIPMDEEGLEVANIQAHEREHGHRVGVRE